MIQSKYIRAIWMLFMYGVSESELWRTYGKYIGRRRFKKAIREALPDYRNIHLGT